MCNQTKSLALLTMIFMLGITVSAGCKRGEKAASTEMSIPADLKIVLGHTGGFAGRSMGYSIYANGDVLKWEGKYPEENRQATAIVDQDHVQQLWNHASEIKILEMQEQVMGNVTWFITVTADGESRRVTWAKRDEEALTPAQQFFDDCMEVAETVVEEK